MTAVLAPTPLAKFSFNWIGGDIRGLSEFVRELYDYVPQITNVIGALDGQVNDMISAAGKSWQGAGASAFKSSWEKDSVQAQKVASLAVGIGQIVDTLAVNLAETEAALEAAADDAVRLHNVKIAAADGKALDPTSSLWAREYNATYLGSVDVANQQRQDAVNALTRYTGPLHLTANRIVGTITGVGAEVGLVASVHALGGTLGGTMMAGAEFGGAELGALFGESTIAVAAGAGLGFVAVPAAVAYVGYGVGLFIMNEIEGKPWKQSLETAATEPFTDAATAVGFVAKNAAVGIGHTVEHVWDSI
jgi:uncharacterized protein YukE